MSRIVQLNGTFDERQSAAKTASERLYLLASMASTQFLAKEKGYTDRSKSDVIVVYGKQRVFKRSPEEPRDTFSTDAYWSADYIVVLDAPDTTLYNLSSNVPTYPAESGMAHGFLAFMCIGISFFVTLLISLVADQRGLSFVWSFVMATAVTLGFVFEYRLRVLYAGVLGWWYVSSAVRAGRDTKEHYIWLVSHLADCDDPVVTDVNRRILQFI